ncbi:hypothetical protein ACH4PU_31995 [Streptomyces sp. NPDC021100]|uniref:hypothetical protein n=1 Tax=Streptomyces sp. NPDC021100 TaxID=3365114 RepID=UPI00378E5590
MRAAQVAHGQVLDVRATVLEAQGRTLQSVAELVGQLAVGQVSMIEQLTRSEYRLGGGGAQEE